MGGRPARPRVVVFHSYYGCDSGCCGHTVEIEEGGAVRSKFDFGHPYGDTTDEQREFARDLVTSVFGAEHVTDLDWERSVFLDD